FACAAGGRHTAERLTLTFVRRAASFASMMMTLSYLCRPDIASARRRQEIGCRVVGRPRKNEGLTLDGIIQGAWRLVDREGIDGLSTRRLAAELAVQGPALYWHVRNKRQLMGLMIEHALAGSISKAPA